MPNGWESEAKRALESVKRALEDVEQALAKTVVRAVRRAPAKKAVKRAPAKKAARMS